MPKSLPSHRIDFIELPAKSTRELAQSKQFFSEVFRWTYQDWGDNYADTTSSGVGSGINADPDHRPTYPLPVIYTPELELTRRKVVAANGKITREIFPFPGGRRFHFEDPSGNELAVWSDK